MQIKNIRISTSLSDVLHRLKIQSNYFEKGFKERNTHIMCQCPFHKGGQERTPSGSFRKEDGVFHCFGCNETASLDKVVEQVLNVDNGLQWLTSTFGGERVASTFTFNRTSTLPTTKRETLNLFNKEEKEYLKYKQNHPYFTQRKIHPKVVNLFDLGFDEKTNSVTFPVKDINGNCKFIARRRIDKKHFNYPENVDKGLYGLYEITLLMKRGIEIKEVYITESIIDALTIWSYGKYAIALNGTGSYTQYKQINELPFRSFILALDNDEAGENGCEKLKKNCMKLFYRLDLGEKKDVNELSREEWEQCLIQLY